MNIDFSEADHTYKLNAQTVPSVTQVIKETVGTCWQTSEWYLTRGKAIHACAAFIAEGKQFKFDERLSGYISAIKKFFHECEPVEAGSEIIVGSLLYLFAGTLDLKCKIGGRKYLIDYKHSLDKVRIPLQLGGYSQALKETTGEEFNFGIGVEIHENGTYIMTDTLELKIARNQFIALRVAYTTKEKCGELSTQKKLDT
jgi:hypothetical protein